MLWNTQPTLSILCLRMAATTSARPFNIGLGRGGGHSWHGPAEIQGLGVIKYGTLCGRVWLPVWHHINLPAWWASVSPVRATGGTGRQRNVSNGPQNPSTKAKQLPPPKKTGTRGCTLCGHGPPKQPTKRWCPTPLSRGLAMVVSGACVCPPWLKGGGTLWHCVAESPPFLGGGGVLRV